MTLSLFRTFPLKLPPRQWDCKSQDNAGSVHNPQCPPQHAHCTEPALSDCTLNKWTDTLPLFLLQRNSDGRPIIVSFHKVLKQGNETVACLGTQVYLDCWLLLWWMLSLIPSPACIFKLFEIFIHEYHICKISNNLKIQAGWEMRTPALWVLHVSPVDV